MPEKTRNCTRCRGEGYVGRFVPGERVTCTACKGNGRETYISFADADGRNDFLAAYYNTPGRNSGD